MKIQQYIDGDELTLVARSDTKDLAYLNSTVTAEAITLTVVHVEREERSKGIGKALVNALVCEAKSRGFTKLKVEAISSKRALQFITSALRSEPVSLVGDPTALPVETEIDVFFFRYSGNHAMYYVHGVWIL